MVDIGRYDCFAVGGVGDGVEEQAWTYEKDVEL
jgi:hypothetical protein